MDYTWKELNALNTKSGKGNFHVQPNGVFCHCRNKPYILTTAMYQKANSSQTLRCNQPDVDYSWKMNPQLSKPRKHHKRNAVY